MRKAIRRILCLMVALTLAGSSFLFSFAEENMVPPEIVAEQTHEMPEPTQAPTAEPTQEPTASPTAEPVAPPTVPADTNAVTPEQSEPQEHSYLTFAAVEGGWAVSACIPEQEEVVIPAIWQDKPVLVIAEKAFANMLTLQSVVVKEGVQTIEEEAFTGCEMLTSVELPQSLMLIADNAFDGCTTLSEVVAPEDSYAWQFMREFIHTAETEAPKQSQEPIVQSSETPAPTETPAVQLQSDETDGMPDSDLELLALTPEPAPEAAIIISGGNRLGAGKSLKLSTMVIGSANQTISWSSSDNSIATVDAKGTVKAGKVQTEQSVTIRAELASAPEVFAVWIIQVAPLITKVTLQATRDYIDIENENDSVTVFAFDQAGEPLPYVTWKSSNTAIATVDENGVVTAGTKAGTAKITATAQDGSKKSASISIKVLYAVREIKLSGAQNVAVGKSIKLTTAFTPEKPSNKKLIWSSDDTDVATVSNGTVRGRTQGVATIRATSAENADCFGEWNVSVLPAVNSIKISTANGAEPKIDLGTGQNTLQLQADILPVGSLNSVTWKSSSTKIANVDENGLVTANRIGNATITATAADGSGRKASIKLTIVNQPQTLIITGSHTIVPGRSTKLTVAAMPLDATIKGIVWSSSNTSVVTVNSSGTVKAQKKVGIGESATITAELNGVKSDEFLVTVVQSVSAIEIRSASATLDISNGSMQLNAFDEKTGNAIPVTWKTSNTKTATITEQGELTGLKPGKVTVTATAVDGSGIKATQSITIICTPTAIERISEENHVLAEKSSISLKAQLKPIGAQGKIIWESSNPDAANVTSSGAVKALSASDEPIIITAKCGTLSTSFSITTTTAPQKVNVTADKSYINLNASGEPKLSFTANVEPADAYQTITWSSSNANVAGIDENGVVTAHKAGTVTITATTTDNSKKKGTFKLKVIESASSITLSGSSSLSWNQKETLVPQILPATANATLVYTSSNQKVASVTSRGVVTAYRPSVPTQVTITATVKDDPSIFAQHIITVSPPTESVMILTQKHVVAYDTANNTLQLSAECFPEGVSQQVTWSTSDPRVATVDRHGLITGLESGTTVISAVSSDKNAKATKLIRVVKGVQSVEVTGEDEIVTGGTCTLTATFYPENAEIHSVTWHSENESIATVNAVTGEVTAVSMYSTAQTVAITATSDENEQIVATHIITVLPLAQEIIITSDTDFPVDVNVTSIIQLTATAFPTDALQRFEWSSSDESAATVDQQGLVTMLNGEPATITARTVDGSALSNDITITVHIPVEGIQISCDIESVGALSNAQFVATVYPENATNQVVHWTIDGVDSPATIDENGLLTGKSTTLKQTITVRAVSDFDSNIFGTKTITVLPVPQSISLSSDNTPINLTTGIIACQPSVTILPEESYCRLQWSTSDEDIAVVDENGVVTGLKEGTVTITAKADNADVHGEITIQVIHPDYLYERTDDGLLLTLYGKVDRSVIEVPLTIDGENVVALSPGLFSKHTELVQVTLQSNILALPDELFNGCANLVRVHMSNMVATMGEGVFEDCTSLKAIIFDAPITE